MRLYRILLLLYPAPFRAEYGEEMCEIFARAREREFAPVLWIRTVLETLANAAIVHADILRQDLRHTARSLRRSPGFAATAAIVAALGIGATTAAYTTVDYVLIRPLPFARQERLVRLLEDHPAQGLHNWDLSPANYRDWKRMSSSFERMGAYRSLSVNVVERENPQRLDGASMTADIWPILGVQAMLGRVFTEQEDRDGAAGTVVLSYGLWQDLFAGDGEALGRKVSLDGAPYTVIGVMPRGFYFPDREARLWTAMRFAPPDFLDRENSYLYGIGLLKPGVSMEGARAEMRGVTGELARLYPKVLSATGATLTPLRDTISPQSRLMLKALLGAAICVLLIACTNLANLLLARALARRRELAVRAAMGAGRDRLARQMLTESVVLAGLGGVLGVAIGVAALPLLVRLVPVSLPLDAIPSMNASVLLFALVVTLVTGIGFGIVPALRAGRGADRSALREGSRIDYLTLRSGGQPHERFRDTLAIVEISACVALLVCSGLLIRALWRIHAIDPGFRSENVLTLRTVLPMPKYEKVAARERFYRDVLSKARRLPGVTDAAYTSFLPMVMRGGLWPVEIAGRPRDPAKRQNASLRYVTPGYFAAMGIPLAEGRDVSGADSQPAAFRGPMPEAVTESDIPRVAVISRSFANQFWPGQDPVGRHFQIAFFDRAVFAVVGDVRVRGLEATSEPQVYLPSPQVPDGWMPWYPPKDLVVRASGKAEALAGALRRIVHEADPEQPVSDVRLLTDIVDAETGARSVQARALGAFGVIAAILAAVGIHGLLSFAVSQRTREIGVRIALGATRGQILGMILRRSLILAVVGTGLGAALALLTGRAMQSILAGVSPADTATLFAVAGMALLMVLGGSLMPALRAARVDPMLAVRAE
ncbi:MAG TPA: ABC transporter permease [Bryobacteraceae bacterium]